jgi:hypothetical protein
MADRIDLEAVSELADGPKSAFPLDAETNANSEIPGPMLDVHAPHESIHTWKSFFIHIATIVIGLLIAVGLEQTVEFAHHRHQLRETRESLRSEHEDNQRIMGYRLKEFRRYNKILQGNLIDFIYLQQHPGTPMEKLPETQRWSAIQIPAYTSAWSSAKISNITTFMSPAELHEYERVYESLDTAWARYLSFRAPREQRHRPSDRSGGGGTSNVTVGGASVKVIPIFHR